MSEFQVRYLTEEEYDAWDTFVDQSEYGTVFHKTYWNQAIFALDPSVSIQVVACFKEERIVAGLITGSLKKFGLIRTMVPPYASPFYGPLIKERDSKMLSKQESYRHQVMDEFLGFIEKEYQIINFSFPPGFKDIRSFNQRDYQSVEKYTYMVDTAQADLLFDKFLPALRRQIKKGEKLEYRIRELNKKEEMDTVYELIETSYSRQMHPFRFDKKQFRDFMANPALDEHLKVYSIWYKEQAVAAIALLIDRGIGYYWLAGVDHQFSNTGLNQVLLWQLIRRMPELGIHSFDFIGANTPSISKYKSGYNFNLVSYHGVSKETGRGAHQMMSIKRFIKQATDR
ncbi:MAG: GNAT family N-acetyltransferase [Bacteroidota bacterium]